MNRKGERKYKHHKKTKQYDTSKKTNSKRGRKAQRIRLPLFWREPPTLEQLRIESRRSRKGMAGSPRTISKRITQQPTTHQERTHQHGAPFLFVWSSVREKETTTTHNERERTSRGQQDQRGQRKGLKDKRRANTDAKGQNERQTRHKPQNRLTTHAHKSHTSHAKHPSNTNPHKHLKPR